MERSKLGKFIDNLVICVIITLLSFIWLRGYFINNIICLIISLLLCFITIKTILHFQNKRYAKLNIEKEEIHQIKQTNIFLRKQSQLKQTLFFKSMLEKYNPIRQNGLLICNNFALTIKLNQDNLTESDIYSTYAKISNKTDYIEEVYIICNELTDKAQVAINSIKNVKFIAMKPVETYALIKKHNKLPLISDVSTTQKTKKTLKIKYKFMQKQAKGFLKCGIMLYFVSLFIPYTKYYIIVASICMLISAICLCFGQKDSQEKQKIALLDAETV